MTANADDGCPDSGYFSENIAPGALSDYVYEFSRFDPAQLVDGKIEFRCKNYRNPLFAQDLEGFSLNVKDREKEVNNILLYPEFSLDTLPDPDTGEVRLSHVGLEPITAIDPATGDQIQKPPVTFTLTELPPTASSVRNRVPI